MFPYATARSYSQFYEAFTNRSDFFSLNFDYILNKISAKHQMRSSFKCKMPNQKIMKTRKIRLLTSPAANYSACYVEIGIYDFSVKLTLKSST